MSQKKHKEIRRLLTGLSLLGSMIAASGCVVRHNPSYCDSYYQTHESVIVPIVVPLIMPARLDTTWRYTPYWVRPIHDLFR